MSSIARLRSLLNQVLRLHEPPHRTAMAFAIGVFIAFSPTYGLHTLSAVFFAWAFRLNALALFAGAFLNNPWTVVPILGATFWTGFQILGMPSTTFQWNDLSTHAIYEQAMPYVLPFVVGALVLSTLGSLVCYPLAYLLISNYRARLKQDGGHCPREFS